MPRVAACLAFDHAPALMALAAIGLLVCLTWVGMLSRAAVARGNLRLAWAIGAAAAFGGGVWATGVIALIGCRTPPRPDFTLAPALASLAVAVAASAFAAALLLRRSPRPGAAVAWRGLAGLLLGGGIAATQFAALLALRRAGQPGYDAGLMGAALALGTALALGAAALAVLRPGLAGIAVDAHLARRPAAEARRLRLFAEATFEGILFCRDGLVTDANGALARMGGWDPGTMVGWRLERLFDAEAVRRLSLVASGARTDTVETALRTSDGSARPVELLCRPISQHGETATVVAVRDIAERKAAERRIGELAHYDTLTGCANRTLFRDRLAQALALAERPGHGVALLYGNVDGFMQVNELLGHAVGDRLLIELANRLRARLRDSDTLARLAGDEFAIIQPRIATPEDAAALAERLLGALAEPFEIDGHQIQVGMTVGVALHPQNGATGETLLRTADVALRRGKRGGPGRFHFYTPQMDRERTQRLALERDLAQALPRGELSLHYQPVFAVLGRRLIGHEALLRWEHPERGAISPAEFVPLAEQSRLIVPIGQWVLRTACAAAAALPTASRIAVNLSPVQVRTADLPRIVAEVLRETGLAAERLELEITEGVLIEDSADTLATLRALKRLGVRLALDDFGTGYSSLSYLRRFPFDKLKIDRSFMQGLGEDGESDAIVRAILALGRSLRLEVTAEGVETETQLRMLRHYGCDQAQGYLLGRPGFDLVAGGAMLAQQVAAA